MYRIQTHGVRPTRRRRVHRTFGGVMAALVATLGVGVPSASAQESSTSEDSTDSSNASLHRVAGIEYPDVRSITQDSQGFIWFGINHPIEGGLVRYDGYEARRYTHDLTDETSLSHSQVSLTYIDRDGVLWVGTIRGGLNRYNAESDDFTRYLHDPDDETTLPSDDIETIVQTADRVHWVGTETGLSRFDPATGQSTAFFHDPDDPNSLPGNRVRTIVEDPETGELWIGTSGGLAILDPTTMTFRNYASSDAPTSLSADSVEVIVRDSQGVWWLGTAEGLDRYNPATDDFTRLETAPDTSTLASASSVQAILEDSQGRLWVGGAHGLKRFDRDRERFVDFTDEAIRDAVIGQTVVQSIFEDADGAIWIGTQTQGAGRISPMPKGVGYHRHDPDDSTTIDSNFVARVEATPAGLWLVTDAGVEFFDGTTFTDHTAAFGLDGGWPEVHGILASDDPQAGEILWLGLQDGRLARVEVDSGSVEYFDVPEPADDSPVWPVAHAANGDVWYRIPWHYGMGVLHPSGESELLIGDEVDIDFPEQAYAFNTAHYFDADEQVLWVTGLGLTRIDVATGDVAVFSYNPDNPKAVQNQLWSVDKGVDGRLWLGSSNGVMEFDPVAERYVAVHSESLPARGATDARFGSDGRLWVVAGPTLTGMDPDSGDTTVYGFDDAAVAADMLAMENRVASKLVPGYDGKMYAPTLEQGLMSFAPGDLVQNPAPPPAVLTGFQVFGEEVPVGGDILSTPINLADSIRLAPDQNTFTFEFSALGYEHPESNQFRYRLVGFNDDWRTTTSDRRFASYTNVPPGNYTFEVQVSNNSGVWNDNGSTIAVVVATPWYETWWVRVSALVGLAVLVIGIVGWRTRRERDRTRQLEERLAERVRHNQERELLLAQMQEQSERLTSILAAAPVGVVLLGPDLDVLLENRVASDEFVSLATLDADGHLVAFGDLDVAELLGPNRTGTSTTLTVSAADGERSLSVTVRPIDGAPPQPDIPDDHNDSRGWVLLWDDITQLEELQQRRARQDRLAAVGRFAAGIAHDVNNVLGVIGLKADLLNLDADVSDEAREHIVHISRETGNAAKFITQILDFSRQSVSERRLLDACGVVEDQVRQLRAIMAAGTTLEFIGQGPSTIEADPVQLERVVLNLVKNAQDAVGEMGTITVVVDHVSPGLTGTGVVGNVEASPDAEVPEAWVRLAVHDDGVGIDAEILPTIFDPFVTTKPAGKGTGLGLAQVAGIAAEHEGRVTVETGPATGTTVSVHFPAAKPAELRVDAASTNSALADRRRGQPAMVIEADVLPQSAPVRPDVSKMAANAGQQG